ncbi:MULTISPECIES: PD-(D/E)XK nuclease family protein [unclassified Archaeoglobus]|jgi:CRISPR-associated exonuclease Cas4|uniref:hypothetical protein n=1 Tax=unclassified Archaeoglobus TaxID=2643606 RepID=UPI0025B7C3B6|nr:MULTISPECIES: hypothetical protein [unclassified Archaeoglobus]
MIRLSQLTSYLTCPRLCYYRIHFGETSFTEMTAAREIYFSLRQGFDFEWAKKRAESLHDGFDCEIFNRVAEKFVYMDHGYRSIEIDALIKSEALNLLVSVEEVAEVGEDKLPLFLSLYPPEKGVWRRDLIKAGAASLAGGFREALFYYAYTGELRRAEATFGIRKRVLRLMERVKLIQRGFLPERRESGYCNYCSFKEDCESRPETFASKFL